MASSPLQTVKEKFGGRAQLVSQLVGLVDKQGGDASETEVKSRLMGLSNAKLLRLYRVEQVVRERFGDRAKLVQHLVDARKTAGLTADATYVAKLDRLTKAHLVDLANQQYEPAPKPQTAEQKLAGKRGRKQRERAMSKIKAK